MDTGSEASSAEEWLLLKFSVVPNSSVGWFRAGVGFYNKKQFAWSIECFHRSVQLDPLNYNAYQIMARACIAVNRRDDAIEALKKSVKLDNPSDWQLLVELTRSKDNGQAATSNRNATGDTVDNTSTPLTDSNDFPPVPPAEPAEDTGARPDYAPAAKQDGGTGGTDANNNQDNNNTAATAHDAGAGIDTDINKDNDHDDDDDNNSLTETTVTTNPAQ
eukprot:TRINITY_DN876_c0_g1_i2.p1 TRINITY_DN876_c0_g1~~TRINITY_DN876_c0_g1_i2.p1  ORF type:complete len:218 (-),score=56.35 TRINITY_DN876_c0_g1_i2:68-721(-)